MACSSCGGNVIVGTAKRLQNAVPFAIKALTSFKDTDFVLKYLVVDVKEDIVGETTKINYGKRKLNEQFLVHVNDVDTRFSDNPLVVVAPVVDTTVVDVPVVQRKRKQPDVV